MCACVCVRVRSCACVRVCAVCCLLWGWVAALCSKYGPGVNIGKAIAELKGLPVGPPRLPRLPMSDEGKAKLRADLDAIGFFEWA